MSLWDWFNKHTHVTPGPEPSLPWLLWFWEPSAVDRLAALESPELQERIDRFDRYNSHSYEGTRTGRLSSKIPQFSNMPKARL